MIRPFLLRILKLRLWLAERVRLGELQATLCWAGLVGFIGGLASVLFRFAIGRAEMLLVRQQGDLVEIGRSLVPWERFLVPVFGGLVAGSILHFGSRLFRHQHSTDYMEAISLGNGVIRTRSTLVKSASSLFTIASGGSIGREGPMVQLSAMAASWIGRTAKFSTPRLQLLVACGAAAGIASAYNAPVAGALFVAEIVLGSIAMESFGPLIFSSVIATVTVRAFLGDAPVYHAPPFHLVSNGELLAYLLLGLALGAAAPLFLRLLELGEKVFARLKLPAPAALAFGGVVVGFLSLASPEVWGNGYDVVALLLHGGIVWQAVLVVVVLKMVATSATAGSGAVGGVFTPTIFVGAALGFLFGAPIHALWPNVTGDPSAYAMVGMGCFLAATTHAPLTAILMLFEMTLDWGILPPLMLACVTAYYTSRSIEPKSVYADSLRRKQPAAPDSPLADLRVADLLKRDPLSVPETATFGEVARSFAATRQNYLYVVDSAKRFRGAVSLHDIKAYLNHPDLGELALALDFMREEIPVLTPDLPLPLALAKFAGHDGDRLPVVASGEKPVLVGSLSKSDVLLALAHAPNRPADVPAASPAPGMPVAPGSAPAE
jgi:CIC family chloride channel protein